MRSKEHSVVCTLPRFAENKGSKRLRFFIFSVVLGLLLWNCLPALAACTDSPTSFVDWSGCDKSNANLTNAQLTGADLSGANLSHAKLTGANLIGADLTRTDLTGVEGLTSDQLRSAFRLQGIILSGLNLSGFDLSGHDITGARLTGANLTGANLTGITLRMNPVGKLLVTFTAGANGSLTGASPQLLDSGAAATAVTAVPASGFRFRTWISSTGMTYGSNPLTLSNVIADQTLVAEFEIDKAVADVVIDPAAPATVYAGVDGGGIYKSTDSGATWAAATTQPDNLRVKAVVIKPGDGTKLFAATYGGGLFKSENSAIDWNSCPSQPANQNLLSLTIDPVGKLYAGSEAGIYASNDNCASWQALNNGIPISCATAATCPGSDNDCQARTCIAGACGISIYTFGTAAATQVAGDCKQSVCDGSGNVVVGNDDSDLPLAGGNQCLAKVCSAGVPSTPPLAIGTACNQNGGKLCDGAGACVACLAASDCPGTDSACGTRTCNAGVCGMTFQPFGTLLASQTAGDCKKSVCDGSGNTVAVNDDTDTPSDDGNQCTAKACSAGALVFPASGTTCNQNGGKVCNGAGACVACLAASDCPGTDSACATRTCNAGVCGMNYLPSLTVVASQTAGDCRKNVCDGSGNIVATNDDTDVPPDDGYQCTAEVCNAGVPSHSFSPVRSACTENGGMFCDGAGTCAACISDSDCPPTFSECGTPICTAGVCGTSFAPYGTPTSFSIPGDCKKIICDGSGTIIQINDDTNVPFDDLNECTAEVCTDGVPNSQSLPFGTPCFLGGTACDGNGKCI